MTSVTKSDSSFVAKLGDKLPTMAYTYATTINQLKKANNITDISSTFAFASKSYNLPVSYIIFGANQSNIENLTITLGDTDIKEIALT